jgi:hypothetical protein
MKVQLIRKLAECLDGIDVTHSRVGDILDLPDREAKLLIAERWAVPDVSSRRPQPLPIVGARECSWAFVRAEAADAPTHRTRTLEQLRHLREQVEHPQFEQQERRRAEDRVREELQDSRAKTIHHNARD